LTDKEALNKSLLGTDILSEVLRARNLSVISQANAYLARFERYTISVMTVMEIVQGWHRLQRDDRITQFLAMINTAEVLPMNIAISELAGRIFGDLQRMGQPIGVADTVIAATAIENNLTLITGNQAHYQRIQALNYTLVIENWR
jgi:tRNA(fMet)-specific endonuclease VapC